MAARSSDRSAPVPELISIDDPEDPRIEAYRDVRERDLVGRRGLFIAEGEVVLGHLARSGRFALDSVLIAEKRVERLAPVLGKAPPSTPVYLASEAVLDRIAGFPLHRGVLALGRRMAPPELGPSLEALPERALVLALSGVGNHDNMGGAFRNAAAFGAALVMIDAGCCDPLYRKAIRVSVGTVLTTPWVRVEAIEPAITTLQSAGFTVVALAPRGRRLLSSVPRTPRMAVLLGSEGQGLPAQVLARTSTARIDMASGVDSLNLAACSAVALHHFASQDEAIPLD